MNATRTRPESRGSSTSGEANGRRGRGNLVQKVASELREAILGERLAPGDRLPTEAELSSRYEVSRTVVREAIASLRADGLVESRQGAGVFVQAPPAGTKPPFGSFDPLRVSSTIEILELRTAVEVEAAGLAAARRSPAQAEAIYECYTRIGQSIEQDGETASADLDFHIAIADATNNPRFAEFLRLMGRNVIPRTALPEDDPKTASREYMRQIQDEHLEIVEAITRGDEEGARAAMRSHLGGSRDRYRLLFRQYRAD